MRVGDEGWRQEQPAGRRLQRDDDDRHPASQTSAAQDLMVSPRPRLDRMAFLPRGRCSLLPAS
jgi:hypothetical protein